MTFHCKNNTNYRQPYVGHLPSSLASGSLFPVVDMNAADTNYLLYYKHNIIPFHNTIK